MNTTGALQGAWFYALFRPADELGSNRNRPLFAIWGATAMLVVVLFTTGGFTIYQQEENTGIALMRRPPPSEEKPPVNWFRTNGFGNSWLRVHPILGFTVLFLLPLGMLTLPRPRNPLS